MKRFDAQLMLLLVGVALAAFWVVACLAVVLFR